MSLQIEHYLLAFSDYAFYRERIYEKNLGLHDVLILLNGMFIQKNNPIFFTNTYTYDNKVNRKK